MTVKTLQLCRQGTLTNEQNRPFLKAFSLFFVGTILHLHFYTKYNILTLMSIHFKKH